MRTLISEHEREYRQGYGRRFKLIVLFVTALQLIFTPTIYADWAAGIPTGTEFPQIKAQNQNDQQLTNDNLIGANGLLFFFTRSSDW